MAARSWQPPAVFNFMASLVALAAAVGLAWAAWAYYAHAPWTRDGRVRVYTVQVAPEVSGTVVALPVQEAQYVRKGDLLFQIDTATFENDVKQAAAQLAQAKAQASYKGAQAQRRNELSDLAVSAEQREDANGVAIAANDAVLAATGALDQASLNLARTTLRSPVNGWVTDLLLQRGGFASTGRPAMTVVDADSFWVTGYFEETQLSRIGVGNEARMTLMAYPGQPLTGHVVGLGRGISVADAAPGVQGLPSVNPVFTWVRLAQRIPVRIELDDIPCSVVLASGMTVTVSILDKPGRQAGSERGALRNRGPDADLSGSKAGLCPDPPGGSPPGPASLR